MKKPFKINDRVYICKQIADRPYYISKCGEVISVIPTVKVLKGGSRGGYRSLILTRGGDRLNVKHHHLVMRWWVGPRPLGMVVNHKNGIKTDNRLSNLEYCTPKDNRQHAIAHRLYHSGSRCSYSKLSEEKVILIKAAYAIGMSASQLARAFKVSQKAIWLIVNNKTWKYAEEVYQKNRMRA